MSEWCAPPAKAQMKTGQVSPCEETETFTRQEPVSINVVEERTKLAQLQQRRAERGRAAEQQIQQCVAIHPE